MPDSYTGNLALVKPEVGASRDSWGSKTNANWDTIDNLLYMAMPIGTVLDYCGSAAPSGYLVADGRLVSRVTYSALFAVLGTTFGAGDGSSTFALPNLCGRSSVGPGTLTDANGNSASLSFGQVMGAVSYRIQQAHLPNYAIGTDTQGYHNHGGYAVGGSHYHITDVQGSHNHGGATAPGGDHNHPGSYTDTQGSHAHNVAINTFGGGSSNGLSFQAGAQSGTQSYVTDTQGSHYHSLSISNSGSIQLGIYYDGTHQHTTNTVSNLSSTINGDGSHSHTIYLGGSSAWFPTQSPIIVVTRIIYCGIQGATHTALQGATPSLSSEAELSDIKAELAQLRAMLFSGQRRVQHSPLRGVH